MVGGCYIFQIKEKLYIYSLVSKQCIIALRLLTLSFPIKISSLLLKQKPPNTKSDFFCTTVYTNSTKVKSRQGRSRKHHHTTMALMNAEHYN